ncbi:MAG: SPASM domain-containing protein [Nanoarchaeota archaeon]
MISKFEELNKLLDEIDTSLNKDVHFYVIGWAMLLYYGLKDATKDIDIIVDHENEFEQVQTVLKKLKFTTSDPEEYERIMGLSYTRSLRNVQAFIDSAQQVGFEGRYRIICVGRDVPLSEQAFWLDQGISAKKYTKISRGGLIETPHVSKPRINGCKYNRERDWLHILHTGEVVLCCMDWYRQHVLGDLSKESIQAVWNSERYRAIRERTRESSDPNFICNKCEWSVPYEGR